MGDILLKKYSVIGCCGIDCGLCPNYYIDGSSRCPGCCGLDFSNKHPSCSHITCCVKNRHHETCGECDEFPCSKFDSWFGDNAYDSFVTHKKTEPNLKYIKKYGIDKFIEQQEKRIKLLLEMLDEFNDGRSRNFYCLSAALLTVPILEKSINTARKKVQSLEFNKDDIKAKAKILKETLLKAAEKEEVELKLRKPPH